MVETFTSRIKASNLAEMFVLPYSFIRNMASLENRSMMYDSTMKVERNISYIFNYSPSEMIPTNFGIKT